MDNLDAITMELGEEQRRENYRALLRAIKQYHQSLDDRGEIDSLTMEYRPTEHLLTMWATFKAIRV